MIKQSKNVTIKDFEQLKVLGKGSYAKVTLVRKLSDGNVYAMKILKKSYIKQKAQEERTITERNVLVECNHPNIISLKYSFQNDKKLFFVLEFCQGGELFNLLWKAKRFSEEVCRFYSAQIILSLQYLHSKDIIYRDLKPENVLIDNVGYIRITDFGLSKSGVKDNIAKSVCGTPEYLAPEILLKTGHGKAVDYWTLGCIIYEMYTGQPHFYVESREELFEQIKHGKVNVPKNCSPELKDLLQGLFEKNPEKRLGIDPSKGDIKQHPWFSKVDWDYLYKKQIKPPYIPPIKDQYDCSNFDEEFTKTEINSIENGSIDTTNFKGFTFQDPLSPQYEISNQDGMEEQNDQKDQNGSFDMEIEN